MTGEPQEFGKHVKGLRQAAGLTQAELAEGAGISERTVSDLERGLRSGVYPATARRLAAALNVAADDLSGFMLQALAPRDQDAAAIVGLGGLPEEEPHRIQVPLTRLVGRDAEVGELVGLVRDPVTHLLTVVGPGGIGKTRLAIEVAAMLQDDFDGGAFFVNLSPVDDPAVVMATVAAAVGLQPGTGDAMPVLARRLRNGSALLVLDTFEHLMAAAPAVGALLADCPELTVLATSRAPLHLRGEREVPLRPLEVGTVASAEGLRSPAAELFVERAAAVAPSRRLEKQDLELVAGICARVDGLPLAIELAAARVKHMPLQELSVQLEHVLDPLVGGARDLPARQRTMRATLDWSYQLLDEGQMRVFRALSVFRGGFGREAVDAMLAATPGSGHPVTLAVLSDLVDSSLVQVEGGTSSHARYRLLEVVREWAVERALAAGEFHGLRRRHADFYLALAERAEPRLRAADQVAWQANLLEDEANLRAALTWALDAGAPEVALRLGGALWMFWRRAGLFAEGRAWLDRALAADGEASPHLRSTALWGAGWLAFAQGDFARTEAAGRELLGLVADGEDAVQQRNAMTLIGVAAVGEDRDADAIEALGEALRLCAGMEGSWHWATSLLNYGGALLGGGREEEGRETLERALAAYEEIGDRQFIARASVQVGYADLVMGQPDEAAAPIQRGMGIFAELGDAWGVAEGLEAVATLRGETNPLSAALLAGAADGLRERISARAHPADERITRGYLERARSRVSVEAFDAARANGRELPMDAAVREALQS